MSKKTTETPVETVEAPKKVVDLDAELAKKPTSAPGYTGYIREKLKAIHPKGM